MKKILTILILIFIALTIGYYTIGSNKTDDSLIGQTAKYSQSDIGLEFEYLVGLKGYVLDERIPADLGEELARFIILNKYEKTPISQAEESPVITIGVYNNTKKQNVLTWTDQNTQYSNINLIIGSKTETSIAGTNAITYTTDGLYRAENAVIANGNYIYIVTGQYLENDSDMKKDFSNLIQTIKFI